MGDDSNFDTSWQYKSGNINAAGLYLAGAGTLRLKNKGRRSRTKNAAGTTKRRRPEPPLRSDNECFCYKSAETVAESSSADVAVSAAAGGISPSFP
jgi:hypothetical protein